MLKHRNFLQKWHAKQASGNPMRNPLFPHRDVPLRRKVFLVTILSTVIVIGFAAFLVYGPLFRIQSVIAEGLTSIPEDQIIDRVNAQRQSNRWLIFPENNLLFLDRDALIESLQSTFRLQTVTIDHDGKTLIVFAEERVLEVALRIDKKTYFLNLDGSVSREASPDESLVIDIRLGIATAPADVVLPALQPSMPIIVLGQLADGEHAGLAERMVTGIITADVGLRAINVIPMVHEIIRLEDRWITTKTVEGFDVMIDVTKDVAEQLDMLKTVIDNRNDVRYEYIDVRFGEHVFVKEL